jgi:hypothetical protein
LLRALLLHQFSCWAPVASTPTHVVDHTASPVAVRARDGPAPPPAHPAEARCGVTNRTTPDRRDSASDSRPNQTLADVPPSIGPVVFGTLGVGWVMVRCPQQYDELMRRGRLGAWRAQWLIERRRIGPVIRKLERTVDPLFRQGIDLNHE